MPASMTTERAATAPARSLDFEVEVEVEGNSSTRAGYLQHGWVTIDGLARVRRQATERTWFRVSSFRRRHRNHPLIHPFSRVRSSLCA